MEAKCDACGFTGTCPDSFAGKTIQCPKCEHKFVVKGDVAFSLVEESFPEKTNQPSLVEKEIGSIGDLKVTNKRIVGEINKKEKIGGSVEVRRVNIDVLLNMITGIKVVLNFDMAVARLVGRTLELAGYFGFLFCFLVMIDFGRSHYELGDIATVYVSLLVIWMCGMIISRYTYGKSKVHLLISIADVDYFIPYESSRMKEAKEKCNMLRNAKSEYERLMGI